MHFLFYLKKIILYFLCIKLDWKLLICQTLFLILDVVDEHTLHGYFGKYEKIYSFLWKTLLALDQGEEFGSAQSLNIWLFLNWITLQSSGQKGKLNKNWVIFFILSLIIYYLVCYFFNSMTNFPHAVGYVSKNTKELVSRRWWYI